MDYTTNSDNDKKITETVSDSYTAEDYNVTLITEDKKDDSLEYITE